MWFQKHENFSAYRLNLPERPIEYLGANTICGFMRFLDATCHKEVIKILENSNECVLNGHRLQFAFTADPPEYKGNFFVIKSIFIKVLQINMKIVSMIISLLFQTGKKLTITTGKIISILLIHLVALTLTSQKLNQSQNQHHKFSKI